MPVGADPAYKLILWYSSHERKCCDSLATAGIIFSASAFVKPVGDCLFLILPQRWMALLDILAPDSLLDSPLIIGLVTCFKFSTKDAIFLTPL